MTSVAVALDVGGTKVAAGLIAADGRIVHEQARPSLAPAGTAEVVERLATTMLERAERSGLTVAGIGAGYPEYVSLAGQLTSHGVLEWDAQPAAQLGALVPGGVCVIDSGVRCAARAEARHGAGRGSGSFLFVSLGTGLSSTLVIDGEAVPGTRGEAIGLGELPVPASVDPAWEGTLEQFVSGAGVAKRFGGAADLGAKLVEQRAREADLNARAVLESAGRALGIALAGLVAVLDPELVILSGGVGSNSGVLTSSADRAYAAEVRRRPEAPALLRSTLGAQAGLIGAGLLVHAD